MAKTIKVKYLKLGTGAHTFYDAETGLNLSNKQVVRVRANALHKSGIARAYSGGHLKEATQEEWEKHQLTLPVDQRAKDMQNREAEKKEDTGTKFVEEDDEEEEEEDTNKDSDSDTDDEDEEEELTQSEMIDALKESPLVKDDQKKGLAKMKKKKLVELYNAIFNK